MKTNYWADKLNQGENLLQEFKIGNSYKRFMLYVSLAGSILLAVAGFFIGNALENYFLIFIAIGAAIFSFCYFTYFLDASYRYALTNKRILIMEGYLHTKVISIDYETITDVKVYETLINKLFTKTANIFLNTAGSQTMEGALRNIENPYEIKRKISQLTEEYRAKSYPTKAK